MKNSNSISDKKFGIIFSSFFILINIIVYFYSLKVNYILFVFTFILILITFLKPGILRPFNVLWVRLGFFLGSFMPPLFMGLLFIIIFIPIGVFLKILKINLMDTDIIQNKKTFWKEPEKETDMKRQF
jgi:hypothetical protein